MLSNSAQQRLWSSLFNPTPDGEPMEVFALLDGASVRMLPDFLEDEGVEHCSLLPTTEDPVERTRATYVARIQRHSRAEDWLGNEGWGRNWGCFVLCAPGTRMDDLVSHLREITQVRLPDGRIVLFRFYDPRVWKPFLPTCDDKQLKQLFGVPIMYGCEDESSLILDRLTDSGWRRTVIQLDDFAVGKPLPGVMTPPNPS